LARLARFIIPGVPQHVTQRGNGRQQTFFGGDDYVLCRNLLREHATAHGVSVWGWVLMPNHVHLILVSEAEDSLRACLSNVHRTYAGHIHALEKRTGHFWQGRFGCVGMDEAHLMAAIPCVALNLVWAQLVQRAEQWLWSRVFAHLNPVTEDGLTATLPVLDRVGDFASLLDAGEDEAASQALRLAGTIGRPLGDGAFMAWIVSKLGCDARLRKRGPAKNADQSNVITL
jgi:putative transposase